MAKFLSYIYYCNPSAPYQKGGIEVGHEFIRRVLPKGKVRMKHSVFIMEKTWLIN